MISSKMYDALKQAVTLVLPAMGALYVTLASLWDLPNPEVIAGILAALATFGGILMKVSTKSWNNSQNRFDGELIMTGYDSDTGIPDLRLRIVKDPNQLMSNGTVLLRSVDET